MSVLLHQTSGKSKAVPYCGSWLEWRVHFSYPETIWVVVGLFIAVIAATTAWVKATDAGMAPQEAEILRGEISVVADQVAKIAYVFADGSGRWGGIPEVHLEQIERYKEAMRPYLSPGLDAEIENTIRELNEQIRQQNQSR